MMAEIYGKKTGLCKGKGGSMHIADFEVGMLGANGVVGGGYNLAVKFFITRRYRLYFSEMVLPTEEPSMKQPMYPVPGSFQLSLLMRIMDGRLLHRIRRLQRQKIFLIMRQLIICQRRLYLEKMYLRCTGQLRRRQNGQEKEKDRPSSKQRHSAWKGIL